MSSGDNPTRNITPDAKVKAFAQEALELLQVLESDLLTLEAGYDISKIHNLVQATHLLQGGAATFGWSGIETLARHLENTFQTFYQRELEVDPPLQKLLLQAYFCLRIPLLAQILLGKYDSVAAITRAEPVFIQLESKLGYAIEVASSARMMGSELEIAESLFTVGTTQWLQELETILSDLTVQDLAGTLNRKAEALAGLGEYLNLPRVVTIARNMLLALRASPHHAFAIGEHALRALHLAQETLEQGDRSSTQSVDPVQTTSVAPVKTDVSVIPSPEPEPPRDHLFVCLVDSVILTLPFQNIVEIFIPQADLIKQFDDKRFVYWREQMLPVYRLSELLECARSSASSSAKQHLTLLVFTQENQTLALELKIQHLIQESDLVIQPLTTAIARPPYLGCTIWQESQLIFVIDGLVLLSQTIESTHP